MNLVQKNNFITSEKVYMTSASVWHAFLRDLIVLPAHPAFIR